MLYSENKANHSVIFDRQFREPCRCPLPARFLLLPRPGVASRPYHWVRFRHPRIPAGLGSITFGATVCLELYVHLLCHTIVTRLTTYGDKNAFRATKSQQKWTKLPNLVRSESVLPTNGKKHSKLSILDEFFGIP